MDGKPHILEIRQHSTQSDHNHNTSVGRLYNIFIYSFKCLPNGRKTSYILEIRQHSTQIQIQKYKYKIQNIYLYTIKLMSVQHC